MQPTTSTEVLGPWTELALRKMEEWDPAWAETRRRMSTDPWTNGTLSIKLIELICIGLNAAYTNFNAEGTRRHIRAALDAGATRDEILYVLKTATVMAIHPCVLASPIACKEASAPMMDRASEACAERLKKAGGVTPAIDKLKAIGLWSTEWESMSVLDRAWADEFIATGLPIYTSAVLPDKDVALLNVALAASLAYSPGVQRHIRNAIRMGATLGEIMDSLKICVAQGVTVCNLAVPMLAEELARQG